MDYNFEMLWCYMIAKFNNPIDEEMSLQVMRCDRLLICDRMIAVHYGHLSPLLQTRSWVAAQHRSHGHMQLGGI